MWDLLREIQNDEPLLHIDRIAMKNTDVRRRHLDYIHTFVSRYWPIEQAIWRNEVWRPDRLRKPMSGGFRSARITACDSEGSETVTVNSPSNYREHCSSYWQSRCSFRHQRGRPSLPVDLGEKPRRQSTDTARSRSSRGTRAPSTEPVVRADYE